MRLLIFIAIMSAIPIRALVSTYRAIQIRRLESSTPQLSLFDLLFAPILYFPTSCVAALVLGNHAEHSASPMNWIILACFFVYQTAGAAFFWATIAGDSRKPAWNSFFLILGAYMSLFLLAFCLAFALAVTGQW